MFRKDIGIFYSIDLSKLSRCERERLFRVPILTFQTFHTTQNRKHFESTVCMAREGRHRNATTVVFDYVTKSQRLQFFAELLYLSKSWLKLLLLWQFSLSSVYAANVVGKDLPGTLGKQTIHGAAPR
jgi:hypothetical protein